MSDSRTGIGYDVHRFGGSGPVILAGVAIDSDVGVLATSDGDVATHALCDALLGSVAAGDLGMHFPSSDPQWQEADSLDLLRICRDKVTDAGYSVGSVDITIIVEGVRISPHRDLMARRLADVLEIPIDRVSVKATTTDGLGWIGTGDGLAAQAVATVHA
ncbi:MAG: 2-C-methyl-D-erythritol 2,4-cyclodiphosphate synthase [Actinomycetota bacterium]